MGQDNLCILVVDDDDAVRHEIQRYIQEQNYSVLSAASGIQAIKYLEQIDIDLILLDLSMPELDGYEVLQLIKQQPRTAQIPIMMLVNLDEKDQGVRCIEAGASDFMIKPVHKILLHARVDSSLDKKRLLRQQHRCDSKLEFNRIKYQKKMKHQLDEVNSAFLALLFAVSKLAVSKGVVGSRHLDRLREYCKVLAMGLASTEKYYGEIGNDFIDTLYAACPLYDIGMVAVPEQVLLKNGGLNENELSMLRMHTELAGKTLQAIVKQYPDNKLLRMGMELAQSHHEKWDGSGYPRKLCAEEIPLCARILALADKYDQLSRSQFDRQGLAHEQCRQYIVTHAGSDFDPDVVEVFVQLEKKFIEIRMLYAEPVTPAEDISGAM